MKNLKKVLAMVLAFACTFTMFASAKVYEDVQPGTEFSEAITMLSDLGIIQGKTDGKYHPEETITRAEACALIARLLTGDPNVANFGGAQNFTDVVKGSWQDSAIGYCVANDITVGVGNGKFEPNRAINDQEFLTMMVRALGYETPDVKMGYPFSYMTVANAIGLRHDTNMMANTDALRGEDAQIIYNAMFVDYAKGAKMINTTHGTSVEKYPTLAESVWGLNRAALGTWNKKDNEDVTLSNCKAHTWVIIGEAQDEENALLAYPIDDESTDLYKAEEKKHEYKAYKFKYEGDADALKGYQVELWGAGKHGDPVWEKEGDKFVYSQDWNIKAIKTVAGQTKYDYNSSMADKKDDNGEIVLNEETTLKLESVADNAKNVQHSDEVAEVVTFVGDKLNTVAIKADKDVEKALNVRNGMQFKLMDWDTDGDIDWIVVDEARYFKVDSASSKRVNVTAMKGNNLKSDMDSVTETWKIDDSEKIGTNDAKKDVKIKYEVPEGLKEGDIVEVTYKVTYEGKAQLITATATVVDADNQKLEKVGTKDGLTMTFGDKEVKVAQNAQLGDVIVPANPEKYKDFNGEELGTEFALYKNRNGFIVYSDYATESSNYMMVLNTYGGKDTTGNRDLAVIDFVDADNKEHKDVKVSSGARVLGKDGSTLNNHGMDAYTNRKFDEEQVVGNVFKYWTDEDGVITKMQAVFTADDAKADTAKVSYKYKADADRLIDDKGKYVASLEDANIIFAVKKDYIKVDNNGMTATRKDLKVNSSDVLATKQKDIPDIGYGETANMPLLDYALQKKDTWLGDTNKNHFVVNINKNSEANAAILGVDNFNKFAAGQTKLALVTNVSKDSKGVIEAEVAFDGKVESIASVEKQDFEDIVKVFDGKDDQDVTGVDALIKATDNGVFDGKRLSEVVNQGGQYAEVTTDADGKLTKLVFMDDDTNVAGSAIKNGNKLRGHYYTVSRNLVLNANDKKLKFNLNNNQTYADVVAEQRFASADDLYTVGRLEADSASYADDAKFYQISEKPSRHDKDYAGTQLTVNAGFDNLKQSDIKAVEKSDIDSNEQFYDTKKNIYEIADLAFNSDNDLVAVYSFKSMNEKDSKGVLVLSETANTTTVGSGDTLNMTAVMMDGSAVSNSIGYAVYDENNNDVSNLFTITNKASNTATIVVKPEAPNGTYYVRLLGRDNKPMAGSYKFAVANTTNVINITDVKFMDAKNTPSANDVNVTNNGHSFDIQITTTAPVTRAAVDAKLTKNNVSVYTDNNTALTVDSVVENVKAATSTTKQYTVTVAETINKDSNLKVVIFADENIQVNGATSGNVMEDAAAQVVAANDVTATGSFTDEALIGLKAGEVPAGSKIYVKIANATAAMKDKITVETADGAPVSGVTVQANSSNIFELTGTWEDGKSYNIVVDGVKAGSVTAVAPSYKVAPQADSETVEYFYGTATFDVTDIVAMTATEVTALKADIDSNTAKITVTDPVMGKDKATFTVKVAKDKDNLLDPGAYTVKLGTVDAGKQITVAPMTLTAADVVVTKGTATNSKIVANLQHAGENIDIDALPAAVKTELTKKDKWAFGGTNVNGATVKDAAIAAAELTINADTADFDGQDVKATFTSEKYVKGFEVAATAAP